MKIDITSFSVSWFGRHTYGLCLSSRSICGWKLWRWRSWSMLHIISLPIFWTVAAIFDQVTRSGSVPPSTRDALYQGLPPTMKCALRSRLQSFQLTEEVLFRYFLFGSKQWLFSFQWSFFSFFVQFTVPKIKEEMEKTLQWLVPLATNTTK